MSDMPERIWAGDFEQATFGDTTGSGLDGQCSDYELSGWIEYRRADTCAVWVPVGERLPPHENDDDRVYSAWVYVQRERGFKEGEFRANAYYNLDEKCWLDTEFQPIEDVTHWLDGVPELPL